ncbi:MAG: hypothetical protein [Cressdnaviricota sp.]|nr:MAG: hypothetical protein [Cressdnaviricota sp.]
MGSRWRSRALTDKTNLAPPITDQLQIFIYGMWSVVENSLLYMTTRLELNKFPRHSLQSTHQCSEMKFKNQVTRVRTCCTKKHKVRQYYPSDLVALWLFGEV